MKKIGRLKEKKVHDAGSILLLRKQLRSGVIWSVLTLWWVLIRIVRSTNNLSNCRLLSSSLLYSNGSSVRIRMIVKLLSLEMFLDINRKFKLSRLNMMRLYRRIEDAMMRISHLLSWNPRLTMIYLLDVLRVMLRSTYNMSNCRVLSSSLLNPSKKMQSCWKSLVSWGGKSISRECYWFL